MSYQISWMLCRALLQREVKLEPPLHGHCPVPYVPHHRLPHDQPVEQRERVACCLGYVGQQLCSTNHVPASQHAVTLLTNIKSVAVTMMIPLQH